MHFHGDRDEVTCQPTAVDYLNINEAALTACVSHGRLGERLSLGSQLETQILVVL